MKPFKLRTLKATPEEEVKPDFAAGPEEEITVTAKEVTTTADDEWIWGFRLQGNR